MSGPAARDPGSADRELARPGANRAGRGEPAAAGDAWGVVGLGNPEPEYAGQRHNVGHMVVDLLAARAGGRFRRLLRARSDVAEVRLGQPPGVRAVLAKPRSYMNESGGPISALARYHKLSLDRLVVIHDDLDIAFGALRVKRGGGDGGHNGLRSIRAALGSGDFFRVRVGIGRPPGRQDPADFVLSRFVTAERAELTDVLDQAADAVESLLGAGVEVTQSRFNR